MLSPVILLAEELITAILVIHVLYRHLKSFSYSPTTLFLYACEVIGLTILTPYEYHPRPWFSIVWRLYTSEKVNYSLCVYSMCITIQTG